MAQAGHELSIDVPASVSLAMAEYHYAQPNYLKNLDKFSSYVLTTSCFLLSIISATQGMFGLCQTVSKYIFACSSLLSSVTHYCFTDEKLRHTV